MRKCINGHISFGSAIKCKKCNSEVLIPNKFWRYGEFLSYATGSASEVYKAIKKDKRYILKVVQKERSKEAYEYAKREVNFLKELRECEHVVRLVDWKIDANAVYLLEEYYENVSQSFRYHSDNKRQIKELGIDICQALIECRDKGIYQLDVQPRNLYVDKDGHGRLGDFSIALFEDELEQTKDLRGTLAYMAPEAYHKREYSEQAEIYSLGLVLYCMVSGGWMPFSSPFGEEDPVQKRLSGEPLPFIGGVAWMDFFNKACAFEKEERFATLEECLLAIKAIEVSEGSVFGFMENIPRVEHRSTPSSEEMVVGTFGASGEEEWMGTFAAFDADEFAMTCLPFDEEPTEETQASAPVSESKKLDKVQFSAVAPKEFVKGEYTLVDIFMYEEAYQYVVEEHMRQADTAMSQAKTGFYEVGHNVNVKIVLSSPDIEIDDAVEEGVWTGRYLNFSFAVEVPETYAKRQILFVATMYIDGVITAKLKFIAKMTSLREQKMQVLKEDILSVFVSYASQDRQRVAQVIQGMKKARPEMDVFFDVNSLRSGEDWEHILQHEIEKRDILFLCWSKNAKASEWVEKEWHYALANKGAESIEPIPLEPPTECPPPDELKHKHFNDAMLFIINQ